MVDTSRSAGTAPVVVALGGNTLLGADGPWTFEAQREVVASTAERVAAVLSAGHRVVLTHGNGPQVGTLLQQQEAAPDTPQLPLDAVVAETQAQIGYLLQQALDNAVERPSDFVTVVTQVVVDPTDPAFEDPTKPVGPTYTAAEAAEQPFETRAVAEGDSRFRRVVPSPEPRAIVEAEEITRLVDGGTRVVCAGGGGVPVVRDEGLRGVEAVVDKDKTSQVLASHLGADPFVILTDVDHAYVNYGEPDQRALESPSVDALRAHLEAGEFGAGTMRPKIEACLRFVEAGGERAVIAPPDRLAAAIAGDAGTRIEGV